MGVGEGGDGGLVGGWRVGKGDRWVKGDRWGEGG